MIKTSWLQAANNLDAYHAETRAWRDKKVVQKDINPGDLVLIRHLDKQEKLQSQWYVRLTANPFILMHSTRFGVLVDIL